MVQRDPGFDRTHILLAATYGQLGRIDEAEWEARITDQTALASLIHVNNETGVILDVARLAAVAADRGVPVHVDAM